MRRCHLLASLVMLSALGCDALLPEFRVTVQGVPKGTTRLQIAAHVADILTQDDAGVDVEGPQERFTFGVNFQGMLHNTDATLSVAARRADGCLLAVGTSGVERPTFSVTDVTISLQEPTPALGENHPACKTSPLTIVSVLRRQEGPYQATLFSLLVAGWGFAPGLSATVQSTASLGCRSDQDCALECQPDGTRCGPLIDPSMSCRTNCSMLVTPVSVGPGLVQLDLHSSMPLLQNVMPIIGFAELTAAPLIITVKNPDASSVTFTELSENPR